jgi:hypothetical protein
MKISDAIAGAIGLFLAIFAYWRTLFFPNFGIPAAGPRFFPQLLAVLLGGVSAFLLVHSLLAKQEIPSADKALEGNQAGQGSRSLKVLGAIVGSVLYLFAMRQIGFFIATFLYFVFLMLLMQEERKILKAVSFAIAVTGVTYVIFAILLRASLPIGVIFR